MRANVPGLDAGPAREITLITAHANPHTVAAKATTHTSKTLYFAATCVLAAAHRRTRRELNGARGASEASGQRGRVASVAVQLIALCTFEKACQVACASLRQLHSVRRSKQTEKGIAHLSCERLERHER